MVRQGVMWQFIIKIDDAMRNLTEMVTITVRLEMLPADWQILRARCMQHLLLEFSKEE